MKEPQQFEDLILSNINGETVESYFKDKNLLLVFVIKYDKNFVIEFPISLERKENDVNQLYDEYAAYITRIDKKLDQVIKEVHTKFDDLERKLDAKNKESLSQHFDQFEKTRKEQTEAEIFSYRELKNEIFKDVSLLTILKSCLQNLQNSKNDEVEYLYSSFLPPQNNDGYVTLSNGNFTYNRTTGSWYGMKCPNINKLGKFVFSIRIDAYANALMIGFCISNKVNISGGSGYYSTNQSFMFYIASNAFYNKGSTTQYTCFVEPPKVGDIFSVLLDTKQKCMVLYYNGRQLSIPKPILVEADDKIYLAPCVDMVGSGTTITLIDFKEIVF